MGVEYRITFSPVIADSVDTILRSATCFSQTLNDEQQTRYEYRLPANSGAMPDAEASIETFGIYFCDFGGGGDILSCIVRLIAERFGTPEVSELE